MNAIPTFVITQKERTDRLEHIRQQFADKPEFNISLINLIEDSAGAIGLWHTIKYIIQNKTGSSDNFIVICHDDHQFTDTYSRQMLLNCIIEADNTNADVLLGGVSWYRTALGISDNLFLIDRFLGLNFVIIYSRFFERFIKAKFGATDVVSYKISELATRKIVMHPFIAMQKEPGCPELVVENSTTDYPLESFENAAAQMDLLIKVKGFYQSLPSADIDMTADDYHQIVIPVYIINLPERTERLEHIKKQFEGKKEFDPIIVEASKHKIGAVGLWNSIIKVINLAIENDDDVIIICEDDHQFTENYTKEFLLKNILEAHNQGAAVLSCGACDFGQVVPLSTNRYWVNPLTGTQFIVVYKKLFQEILKYEFNDMDTADGVISQLSTDIMLLCPFVSVQKDFGYSDITREHNEQKGLVSLMFDVTEKRLQQVKAAYINYNYD